jgi:2'-5' RNA ligase
MYFIAIVLPAELNKKVLKWKNFMNERFGCKVGLKSPAHITLTSPFWMQGDKDKKLTRDVGAISLFAQPFAIVANNFPHLNPELFILTLWLMKN